MRGNNGGLSTQNPSQQIRNAGRKIVVFVAGMGCGRSMKQEVQQSNQYGVPAFVLCNRSTTGIVAHLAASKLLYKMDTPFVRRVAAFVRQQLQTGKQVVFIGHSYGGGVVTQVAATLRHPNLRAATFGSVFVRDIPGVTHFMRADDIVLRYNRLSPRRHTFVKWIFPPGYSQGTRLTWSAHNSYMDAMKQFVAM